MNKTYEEKKFRDKPYTQCFECIQGNRLKCKKCMATLVEDIIRERQKTQDIKYQSSINENQFRRTIRLQPKTADADLEVKSHYGVWMEQVYLRRIAEKNPICATIGCWPHRKATSNRKKMAKIQVPKFESWENRLLARFSKSQDVLKSLEKNVGFHG